MVGSQPVPGAVSKTGSRDLGGEAHVRPVAELRFVVLTPPDGRFGGGCGHAVVRSCGRAVVLREQLAGQRLLVGRQGTGVRAYVDGLRFDASSPRTSSVTCVRRLVRVRTPATRGLEGAGIRTGQYQPWRLWKRRAASQEP